MNANIKKLHELGAMDKFIKATIESRARTNLLASLLFKYIKYDCAGHHLRINLGRGKSIMLDYVQERETIEFDFDKECEDMNLFAELFEKELRKKVNILFDRIMDRIAHDLPKYDNEEELSDIQPRLYCMESQMITFDSQDLTINFYGAWNWNRDYLAEREARKNPKFLRRCLYPRRGLLDPRNIQLEESLINLKRQLGSCTPEIGTRQ